MNKTYKAIFCRSRRALCHSFKVFWQKTHVRLSGNACKFLCLLSEFVWVQLGRCWESSTWINQKNQNGCPHIPPLTFFNLVPMGSLFLAVILEERKLHFRFFGPHCCHFYNTSSELRFHCLSQRCVAELSTWKSCTHRISDKDCSDGQLCMLQSCGTARRMAAFLFWSLQKPLEVTMVYWQSHGWHTSQLSHPSYSNGQHCHCEAVSVWLWWWRHLTWWIVSGRMLWQ